MQVVEKCFSFKKLTSNVIINKVRQPNYNKGGTQIWITIVYHIQKYSLQGTTQGRYLTGGVPPVRFSM